MNQKEAKRKAHWWMYHMVDHLLQGDILHEVPEKDRDKVRKELKVIELRHYQKGVVR